MAIWLVIQHASLDLQKKYLPLLKSSVKNNESSGRHLAMLEDRMLMYQRQPQIYGSQIVTNSTSNKQIVYEIKEPEYVNQRRSSIGLGPIEDYVKRWNIKWTVVQKERE